MDGSFGPDGERGERSMRSSRRAALRLLGASAGTGALLATGSARTGAWQAEGTPAPAATPIAPPAGDADSLFYRLGAAPPTIFADGSSVQFARASEFPVLSGLSLATFEVGPDDTREMHWHNNAGELGWCLGGEGQMVLLDRDGTPIWFALGAGSAFFAPKGQPHAIWTTSEEPMQFLLGFDHQQPATMGFSQMMTALPAAVTAQMMGVGPDDVPQFPTVPKIFAAPVPGGTSDLPTAEDDPAAASYTVRIGELAGDAGGGGTSVAVASIPALVGMESILISLESGGLSAPHWHPEMNEVCFVLDGRVEMGIVGPNGVWQTDALAASDIAFVPVNWLHYIRNAGEEPARVILFHDATTALSFELSSSLSGFPPTILAASYGLEASELEVLAAGEPPVIPGLPA